MDHTPGLDEYFAPPEVAAEKQIPDDWVVNGVPQQATMSSADATPQIPDDWNRINTPPGEPQPMRKKVAVSCPEQVDEVAVEADKKAPIEDLPPDNCAASMDEHEPQQKQKRAVVQAGPVPDKEYEELLRTLGIDRKNISPELAAELPVVIGLLVRECVSGLIEVLMARTKLKSAFRVDQTIIQPVENNPLKFSVGIDEALDNMLLNNNRGYLPALEAVKEGFDDIRAHQMATMAGMQGALQDVLQRFDPDVIEHNFNSGAKENVFLAAYHKTKYWEHYKDLYDDTSKEANDNFQNLLGESFMRAYEEQVRRMTRMGHGLEGGDEKK